MLVLHVCSSETPQVLTFMCSNNKIPGTSAIKVEYGIVFFSSMLIFVTICERLSLSFENC